MRGERIKKLKLITKILETNGFRNPFQIMCDSEFLKKIDSIENGLNIIIKLFNHYPKFIVSQCEFNTYKITNTKFKHNSLSGHCEIIKCDCGNQNTCIINNKLIKSNNKHHYILATNTPSYIKHYRELGIPLLLIKKNIPYIDPGKLKLQKCNPNGKKATSTELKKLEKMIDID